MSLTTDDKESRAKLKRLINALRYLEVEDEALLAIVQSPGDINYTIPFSKELALLNLAPGTILHQLYDIEYDSTKVFELLLPHGVDITKKNDLGQTALHAEIDRFVYNYSADYDPIVKAILSAHVEHSIRENPRYDGSGITHFHVACITNHLRAVQFFLESEVDVNEAIDRRSRLFPGYTALHLALQRNCLETAEMLVKYGASVHLKNAQGLSPMCALVKRNMEIAMCPKIAEVSQDSDDSESSGEAFEPKVSWPMICTLLMGGNNNNSKSGTQITTDEFNFSNFHAACTLDEISMAKSLLPQVKDINQAVSFDSPFCPGYTPLHFAAHISIDMVKFLLQNEGNPLAKDAKGVTPLDVCAQRYSIGDVRRIVSSQPAWKKIAMSDGETKLLDVLGAMQNESSFKQFVAGIEDPNCRVDDESPLWPGYTLLHLAVLFFRRDSTFVRYCLQSGADCSAHDARGSTPLHLAFHLNKGKAVSDLFGFSSRISDSVDESGVSHLFIACTVVADDKRHPVRRLVEAGANVNVRTRSDVEFAGLKFRARSTPLHVLVSWNNARMARLLMECGADLNACDEAGWSPVHRLVRMRSPVAMGKVLFAHPERLEERVVEGIGLGHLHAACRVGSLPAVKQLLAGGADVNAPVRQFPHHFFNDFRAEYPTCTALQFAQTLPSTDVAIALLDAGVEELARSGKGILSFYNCLAGLYRGGELMRAFVERLRGSEGLRKRLKEDSGLTLLHVLAFIGDAEGVEELIDAGAEVNAQLHADSPIWPGCTPLHKWVDGLPLGEYEDARNVLNLLLDAGADVTIFNSKLNTPLHTFNDQVLPTESTLADCRLMLRSQNDFGVNPVNAQGTSHFHIAVRMRDVVAAEKFLRSGADVDQQTDHLSLELAGCSPLHLLGYRERQFQDEVPERVQLADLLLRYGADVRARDVYGNTPLHAVATNDSQLEELFGRIVRAGGAVSATNVVGESPFAVAMKSSAFTPGNIRFLLRQGCPLNVFNPVDQTGFLAPLCSAMSSEQQTKAAFEIFFDHPDIKSVDGVGRTAIHNVVSSRRRLQDADLLMFVVKKLIQLGCDIDAQDHTGKTALHVAAMLKNAEAVRVLLNLGADMNLTDADAKSAFAYAMTKCRGDSYQLGRYQSDPLSTITQLAYEVEKLSICRLSVIENNRDLLGRAQESGAADKALLSTLVLAFRNQMENAKSIKIVESDALTVYDFLSETGAVAAYPTMPIWKRRAVHAFFNPENEVLDHLDHVQSLLRLQYKKTIARAALFEDGQDALWVLSDSPLPWLCCKSVLKYLSGRDMKTLIISVKG